MEKLIINNCIVIISLRITCSCKIIQCIFIRHYRILKIYSIVLIFFYFLLHTASRIIRIFQEWAFCTHWHPAFLPILILYTDPDQSIAKPDLIRCQFRSTFGFIFHFCTCNLSINLFVFR